MTITTVGPDVVLDLWRQAREALPAPVILGQCVDKRYFNGPVHILALRDVAIRAAGRLPRDGNLAKARIITGLDEISRPLPAEACFCGTDSRLAELTFDVWRERNLQHLYPAPTCAQCLTVCARLIDMDLHGLPRHKKRKTRE